MCGGTLHVASWCTVNTVPKALATGVLIAVLCQLVVGAPQMPDRTRLKVVYRKHHTPRFFRLQHDGSYVRYMLTV